VVAEFTALRDRLFLRIPEVNLAHDTAKENNFSVLFGQSFGNDVATLR